MPDVVRLHQIGCDRVDGLLATHGMILVVVPDSEAIPGSYWGEPEAGLIGSRLYVRADTPVHSLLHEACHYLCMPSQRRAGLHTNAGGGYAEENAVCYLQILLAGNLPGINREVMCRDMDAWGYTFRLGSAGRWFYRDAEDARAWLIDHCVIDTEGNCLPG